MTAKEKLASVKMYGRNVSEFLLPDQMEFIEKAMEEYAQQQVKLFAIPDVVGRSEQLFCPIKEKLQREWKQIKQKEKQIKNAPDWMYD